LFTFSFISGMLYGMKISIRTKLALIFFAFACFMGVITSLIINSLVTNQIINEAQGKVKEDLNTARYVYNSKIRDIDRTIRWTSIRHVLKRGLRERNVGPVREELSGLMTEEGLNFLTLVDKRGIVLFRFHHPASSGDSLADDPFVKGALENKPVAGTQVLSGSELKKEGEGLARKATLPSIPTPKEKGARQIEETSGMVLKASHPVVDFNGEVLGVLTGGVLLNRNYEIVDQIKNLVFKGVKYREKEIGTATIFLGDLRISTNVMDKEGNRAIGTRAMKEVEEHVLGQGKSWIQRAFVVDHWYITAYEPILDVRDKIVGMLYVGMMESKYAAMKERLILLFFLFSTTSMLVALIVSFLLSFMMFKK